MVARLSCTLVTALAVVACSASPAPDSASTAPAAPALGDWGVETQYVSADVAPGDDFYRYVNDGWLATAEIPAGFPANTAFVAAQLATEAQIQEVVDGLDPDGSPRDRQLAALHESYLDTARRDALGLDPIAGDLDAIMAAGDRSELARLMGRVGYPSIVDGGVELDFGDPSRYVPILIQGGLGLPGQPFYLQEQLAPLRAAYVDYIERSLTMAGIDRPRERAEAVMALETAIAGSHWAPAQARDYEALYHLMPVSELPAYAPGFDWAAYLGESGMDAADDIIVGTDTAIQATAATFAATDLDTLRSYLAFHLLRSSAPLLSTEWSDASFDFFGRQVQGIAEQRPIDVRATLFVSETLAEPLGQAYAERYFPAETKAQMETLVGYLLDAYGEHLRANTWMDEATRAEALAKLAGFSVRIGYPDRWHDFSGLVLSPDDLVGNVRQIGEWMTRDAVAKLGEPRRDWEWPISPQTINAGYSPFDNSVNFPAAILQAPFFDPNADPAVNFGAIGMAIGHEIGHGFDDQGSRFDEGGALRDWWSSASRASFDALGARLIAQYGQYEPLDGLFVNGQLTLGENIGDLSGLTIALTAYRQYANDTYGGEPPVIDGYTGVQRFFLGVGQLWRAELAEAYLRRIVLTDPHSPNEYRVNGVVRNIDAWYDAFGVTEDDALYLAPDERIRIW